MLFDIVPHSDSHSAAALYALPRCSPDQYRGTSTPIVGSSGSTPLHFAAANRHTNAVRALLSTILMRIGLISMVLVRDVLRQWVVDRDRNLRERQFITPYL